MRVNQSAKSVVFSIGIFLFEALILTKLALGDFITFDNVEGPSLGAFSSLTEAGYTVTAISGDWQISRATPAGGNPQPSIFSRSIAAQIEIVAPTFNLVGFQTNDGLINSGVSTATYSIEGFLNGASVLSGVGSVSPNWEVNVSPNSLQLLDRVIISFNLGQTTGYGIDNIEVRAVPEPSSILSVAIAFAYLLLLHHRNGRPLPRLKG